MKQRPRIGVVLSSGGIRGVYAHTGFMLALQEMKIDYDAIAGCSAGSLVGGFVASGTPLDQWANSLKNLDYREFWEPDSFLKVVWNILRYKGRGYIGLSKTTAAIQFCRRNLSVKTFEECSIPFTALAYNLGTGEKTTFSEGDLASHMVASATVPVLYEPVKIDGEYYCDGALIEFAPTDAICCKHKLDVVLVHHVSQSFGGSGGIEKIRKRPWSLLEIINHLLFRQKPWYLNDNEVLSVKSCPCGCGAMIIALDPALPQLQWPSTSGGNNILASAYNQALQYLSPYRQVMQNGTKKSIQHSLEEATS